MEIHKSERGTLLKPAQMNRKNTRTKNTNNGKGFFSKSIRGWKWRINLNPQNILFALFTAVLFSGAFMNLLNYRNSEYFTLKYSGGYMLLPHLVLFALPFLISLLLSKCSAEIFSSISLVLFIFTVAFFPHGVIPWAGILLLTVSGFYLSFPMLRDRFLRKNPSGLIISACFIFLIFMCLMNIPYGEIFTDFISKMNSTGELMNKSLIAAGGVFAGGLIILFLLRDRVSEKHIKIAAIVFFLIQSVAVGRVLYFRYAGLNTPTYDFNLFAQMFYSMSENFLPVTTLERNMPLSHFKVHISPIFYLMLPFYKLTKDPGVLQILQAVVVSSGIFPAVLIARHFKLKGSVVLFISLIFMSLPAFILSSFYDLHENAFLVPLLLWLLYFMEKENRIMTFAAAFSVLLVKEDAAIYIWTIALYIMAEKKRMKEGLLLFLLTTVYFGWALFSLKTSGQGAMLGRFDNMISVKNLSILSVPLTVLKNPGFFLKTVFSREKTTYLIQTLIPLGFTPFLIKKYTGFILLIPFTVINLISDYPYQANIKFQYNYGSAAFMFFLLLLFLSGMNNQDKNKKRTGFISSLILSAGLSVSLLISVIPLIQYEYFPEYHRKNKETLTKIKSVMDQIPKSSSVTASPFLTGYLSQRNTIYDLDYNVKNGDFYPSDYIVLDLRPGFKSKELNDYMSLFLNNGYEIGFFEDKYIAVLVRNRQ